MKRIFQLAIAGTSIRSRGCLSIPDHSPSQSGRGAGGRIRMALAVRSRPLSPLAKWGIIEQNHLFWDSSLSISKIVPPGAIAPPPQNPLLPSRETKHRALPPSPGEKTCGPEARAPRSGSLPFPLPLPPFASWRLCVRPTTTPSRHHEDRRHAGLRPAHPGVSLPSSLLSLAQEGDHSAIAFQRASRASE